MIFSLVGRNVSVGWHQLDVKNRLLESKEKELELVRRRSVILSDEISKISQEKGRAEEMIQLSSTGKVVSRYSSP